jgi:hypothetical protein
MTHETENAVLTAIETIQDHSMMKAWIDGPETEKALKAMDLSCFAKKPGRLAKRVGKHTGAVFGPVKAIKWEKKAKMAYAAGYSKGDEADVVKPGARHVEMSPSSIFLTDLFLKSDGEITEIDIATISSVSVEVIKKMAAEMEFSSSEVSAAIKHASGAAKIFRTGLEAAEIEHDAVYQFLIPVEDYVMVARNLPIEKQEAGEVVTSQIISVVDFVSTDTLSAKDAKRVEGLAVAMTREGHPGKEAFGALVKANAEQIK